MKDLKGDTGRKREKKDRKVEMRVKERGKDIFSKKGLKTLREKIYKRERRKQNGF